LAQGYSTEKAVVLAAARSSPAIVFNQVIMATGLRVRNNEPSTSTTTLSSDATPEEIAAAQAPITVQDGVAGFETPACMRPGLAEFQLGTTTITTLDSTTQAPTSVNNGNSCTASSTEDIAQMNITPPNSNNNKNKNKNKDNGTAVQEPSPTPAPAPVICPVCAGNSPAACAIPAGAVMQVCRRCMAEKRCRRFNQQ